MKRVNIIICIAVLLLSAALLQADSTIDTADKYGYGANTGWINALADTTNGAVMGQAYCSGYAYSANCGWISLGSGTPTNGYSYSNTSAGDYGINHDGLGNLSGYAWGANIGWINFEQTYGQPKIDLTTGELSGYAWSANTGWINLSGIRTTSLASGPDSDSDGIPDYWERREAGDLTTLGGGDRDGDGASDRDEYLADTDPSDSSDFLAITDFEVDGTTNILTWTVKTTRQYTIQSATAVSNSMTWTATDGPFIPAAGPTTTRLLTGVTNKTEFYSIKAAPPLAP